MSCGDCPYSYSAGVALEPTPVVLSLFSKPDFVSVKEGTTQATLLDPFLFLSCMDYFIITVITICGTSRKLGLS